MADQAGKTAQVNHPFGAAVTVALTATGAQAIEIKDKFTIIDGVTVEATGNRTLNLTIDAQVEDGSILMIASKTAATETTIFGTGITSATITGVAGKTKTQAFVKVGAAFLPVGTAQQID